MRPNELVDIEAPLSVRLVVCGYFLVNDKHLNKTTKSAHIHISKVMSQPDIYLRL